MQKDLKKVAEDTIQIYEEGQYNLHNEQVQIPQLDAPIYITENELKKLKSKKQDHERVVTKNINCVQEIIANKDKKIAVLNFANPVCPGGGFLYGAAAQEECICRCSNLYQSLLMCPQYYEAHQRRETYSSDAIIKSVNTMFKNENYELIEPVQFAVFTQAAVIAFNADDDKKVAKVMEQRIQAVCKYIGQEHFNVVILGAYGCGAFQNDADCVISAFKEGIKFVDANEIVFAVLDRRQTGLFNKFSKEFQ